VSWNFWQQAGSGQGARRSINFPNSSRSYDATRDAVRFWGYCYSMESSFFISAEALKRLQPDMENDEQSCLNAFDRNRNAIYSAATKVYAGGEKGSYNVSVSDL
jgi:hypothetical protein